MSSGRISWSRSAVEPGNPVQNRISSRSGAYVFVDHPKFYGIVGRPHGPVHNSNGYILGFADCAEGATPMKVVADVRLVSYGATFRGSRDMFVRDDYQIGIPPKVIAGAESFPRFGLFG